MQRIFGIDSYEKARAQASTCRLNALVASATCGVAGPISPARVSSATALDPSALSVHETTSAAYRNDTGSERAATLPIEDDKVMACSSFKCKQARDQMFAPFHKLEAPIAYDSCAKGINLSNIHGSCRVRGHPLGVGMAEGTSSNTSALLPGLIAGHESTLYDQALISGIWTF